MNKKIDHLREDYNLGRLERSDLNANPIAQFRTWMDDAISFGILEPNAMTLSTISEGGFPSSRIVLLKEIRDEGFVFYTNYNSRKGIEIQANDKVGLNFLWKQMQRQIRIIGSASKISREESERYFHSRPYGSQIGALTSNQSSPIIDRNSLEERYDALYKQYEEEGKAPLPEYWGGYIVKPVEIEFWQGRSSRLHDRFRYTAKADWKINRLEP